MNCRPSLKPTLKAGKRKKKSSCPSRTGLYAYSFPLYCYCHPLPCGHTGTIISPQS